MPVDRPDPAELLNAVREHLIENVSPLLSGQPAFHLRVAINALAIVERTLADGGAMDQAEAKRLTDLLHEADDLLNLNQHLAAKIRSGELDSEREAVLAHLRETVLDKVRLANPRYLTPRD